MLGVLEAAQRTHLATGPGKFQALWVLETANPAPPRAAVPERRRVHAFVRRLHLNKSKRVVRAPNRQSWLAVAHTVNGVADARLEHLQPIRRVARPDVEERAGQGAGGSLYRGRSATDRASEHRYVQKALVLREFGRLRHVAVILFPHFKRPVEQEGTSSINKSQPSSNNSSSKVVAKRPP